jgi:hypothetical protein
MLSPSFWRIRSRIVQLSDIPVHQI